MEKELLLKEITDKLDSILRLLAINATLNKSQSEQIKCLANAGFRPKEIANLIGTTANTVRVALAHIRKVSKKKGD